MPASTDIDQDLCDEVARHFQIRTTPGVVRELRDRQVLVVIGGGRGSGGRHKVAHYGDGSARAVAMVEQAKSDPSYRRKLHRAVLIAWARGAPVATPGLRSAFREHFRVERRTAERIAGRQQVKESDPALPGLSDTAFQQALADAMLGRGPRTDYLAAMELASGPLLHEAAWRSGKPDYLLSPTDGPSLGLVWQRSNGSWRVEPMGKAVWDALHLAPKEHISREAPRAEFDVARACVRPSFLSAGFDCSDLLVATEVPTTCFHYRQLFGERWWESARRRQRGRSKD